MQRHCMLLRTFTLTGREAARARLPALAAGHGHPNFLGSGGLQEQGSRLRAHCALQQSPSLSVWPRCKTAAPSAESAGATAALGLQSRALELRGDSDGTP